MAPKILPSSFSFPISCPYGLTAAAPPGHVELDGDVGLDGGGDVGLSGGGDVGLDGAGDPTPAPT